MAIRRFHWDMVNDCVSHETDENGNVLVEYTYEPTPYGPLISETRDGVTYTHHYDALGSTTLLTDDDGNVTDTFLHDAWGNEVARTGDTPTPYTWVGRYGYQDDTKTTGGYYIRARTYQPTVARWASVDPIGHDIYRYASLSPVRILDASGLIPCEGAPPAPAPTTNRGSGICVKMHTEEKKWRISTVRASGTDPLHRIGLGRDRLAKVTELQCFYERDQEACYVCSPGCYACAAPPHNMSIAAGRLQYGLLTVRLKETDWLYALDSTVNLHEFLPEPLQPFIPDFELVPIHTFPPLPDGARAGGVTEFDEALKYCPTNGVPIRVGRSPHPNTYNCS